MHTRKVAESVRTTSGGADVSLTGAPYARLAVHGDYECKGAREFFAKRTPRSAMCPARRIRVTDTTNGNVLADVTAERHAGPIIMGGIGIVHFGDIEAYDFPAEITVTWTDGPLSEIAPQFVDT